MMKIQPDDTGTPTPEHDSMPPDVEAAVGYIRSLGIDFAKTLGLVHMYAQFDLLPETWADDFVQRVLRHYGHLSGFVHASHDQIRKHIAEQAAGLRIGFDTTETIVDAASDLFDTCEMSLVACLHAIGPSLAGDRMVAFEDMPWVFHAGRFVAALDSNYDYKVERQQRLVALQTSRNDWVNAGWRAHYIRPTGV